MSFCVLLGTLHHVCPAARPICGGRHIGERRLDQGSGTAWLLSLQLSKQVTGLLAGSTYGCAALACSTDASASWHQHSRQSGAGYASNGRSLQDATWVLFSISARTEDGGLEQQHLPLKAPLQAPLSGSARKQQDWSHLRPDGAQSVEG
jgi:hypothetical protein